MCECETQSQTARACPLADAFVISPLRSHPPCGRRARPLYREAGPDMHCGSGFLPRFFARIAARANSHRGRIRSHNLRNAVLLWERFPTAILRPNRRPRQLSSRKDPLPQLKKRRSTVGAVSYRDSSPESPPAPILIAEGTAPTTKKRRSPVGAVSYRDSSAGAAAAGLVSVCGDASHGPRARK